jgi:hypothetical protein
MKGKTRNSKGKKKMWELEKKRSINLPKIYKSNKILSKNPSISLLKKTI